MTAQPAWIAVTLLGTHGAAFLWGVLYARREQVKLLLEINRVLREINAAKDDLDRAKRAWADAEAFHQFVKTEIEKRLRLN